MRIFFILALHLACYNCLAQSITLHNTWLDGSKIVYIGVTNELILRGKVESITSIHSDNGLVERKGDTLIVKPTSAGVFTIVINTKDQPVSHELNAAYFPMMNLLITDDTVEKRNISKDEVQRSKSIRLISRKPATSPFDDYAITESTLRINNQVYKSIGNALSNETKQAIAQLKTGTVIRVEQATAVSRSTGKILKLGVNQSFTIE